VLQVGLVAAFLCNPGLGRAQDKDQELRALIEQQNKQIQELKKRLDNVSAIRPAADQSKDGASSNIDTDAVKKIVGDYLKDNPGAGQAGATIGYSQDAGFFIRSAPDNNFLSDDGKARIPFELRFRGRIQLDYYNYKVTDRFNHLLNKPKATQNANSVRQADFSQLEVKRLRLIWEGTAFDPDLRYHFEIDGNTRGLNAVQNNKVIQSQGGASDPNGSADSGIGGGATVDHAVRLFSAYVAYDLHGNYCDTGYADINGNPVRYAPTLTLIAGKLKPFMSFEEIMGSANEQMVEYAMTEWFFDADDDNLLMAAGIQYKAFDDRLYVQANITNGNESQFPNTQMDNLPGFNAGFWYDFGGSWNPEKKKWNLYGPSWADIDYSCSPVLRVGGATNIVPMNRRSLYGDDEESRVYVVPGQPQGGTRLINLLNGDATTPAGVHAIDEFDQYTYEVFGSFHYKGFSLTNDWFFHNENNFRTAPAGRGDIIYTDLSSKPKDYLFPANHGLFDYGMVLQSGYFIVPKKWEIVARWSWIDGNSGDLFGNGHTTTTTVPGVGKVLVATDAFHHFSEAREFAIGVNRYWHGEMLKWQTDFSVYDGGNPAGGGQSPAGFIAGSDGWMIRTQIQLAF
jgi:hypothetical protein